MQEETVTADDEAKAKLMEANAARKAELESGAEKLAVELVPALPLDAETKPKQLQRQVQAELARWLSLRTSLFAKATAVDPKTADAQLAGSQVRW